MLEVSPDFEAFKAVYDAGQPQVVHVRLVDDLETPVSAYLKIGHGRPYAFLFESVEGGAYRGRYSIVAMKPDLVWRCLHDKAEISEGSDLAAGVFRPQSGGALDSLRDLIARSRSTRPKVRPSRTAWSTSPTSTGTCPHSQNMVFKSFYLCLYLLFLCFLYVLYVLKYVLICLFVFFPWFLYVLYVFNML